MPKSKTYEFEGKQYTSVLSFKMTRYIYVKMPKEDGSFNVTCSRFVTQAYLDKTISELLPKVLRRVERRKKKDAISPVGEDYIFILGEKTPMSFKDDAAKERFLKKASTPIFEDRIRYYEGVMGINEPYKVLSRKMTSRYGVNSSRTHRITLNMELYHYPLEVIDAIVVHELAHHFVRNHGEKFYAIVYRYCPSYRQLHAKLNRKDYEKDHH